MELMTMLLLCACGAIVLSQQLSEIGIQTLQVPTTESRLNSSVLINARKSIPRKRILLNVNGPALVTVITELHTVFQDPICKKCKSCMERALKASKNNTRSVADTQPNALYYDVFNDHIQINRHQIKRYTDSVLNITNLGLKVEQTKAKNVILTKYFYENGKVYALKVNETSKKSSKESDTKSTCKVYSVKKTLSCDSIENDLILAAGKKKGNKKSKKLRDKKSVTTPSPTPLPLMFKKREVHEDNSHVSESFMPSIEELY